MDMNLDVNLISPFNNGVETGLRILCILHTAYPQSFDLQKLVYLDYITIHSGDFSNNTESLHTPVPYRKGELMIKSSILEKGITLYINYGLIEKKYSKTGIEYIATDYSSPFLETLEEEYFVHLLERAKWVSETFSHLELSEIKTRIDPIVNKSGKEFNIEILQ